MDDKIIVSNSAVLKDKYGSSGVTKIEKAVERLISADSKRGIKSRFVYLDRPAQMKSFRGNAVDDPDQAFYENYACDSPRNYSKYCNERLAKAVDQQSQEIDPKKRQLLVHDILKQLEVEAARPMLDWRLDFFTVWPHVKNLVPHNLYNFSRFQDVWRDK